MYHLGNYDINDTIVEKVRLQRTELGAKNGKMALLVANGDSSKSLLSQ